MTSMQSDNKIVYLGTPDVAAITLEKLLAGGVKIAAVITRPDKPSGRKQHITSPPVKEVAINAGIKVYQPADKVSLLATLSELKPDLMITVAYGMIFTQPMIDIPKLGVLNLHFSLLPKYRGAAPYVDTIINGDKVTGVTIAKTVLALDEGDIIAQEEYQLSGKETQETLLGSLTEIGASLLLKIIPEWLNGKIKPEEQKGEATYTKLLKKEDGHIDWNEDAVSIERKIRAYDPWPGAFTFTADGKRVKIIETAISDTTLKAGYVKNTTDGMLVGTGSSSLLVTRLQVEGKKPVSAKDFLLGNPNIHILN